MTHTAGEQGSAHIASSITVLGFVYANANPLITEWVAAHAIPGNFDPKATIADLALPFIYEPGTSWTYSTALDWVGKLVERVSGLRLDEYFQRNVFDRVEGGMRDVSFFPTPSIKERKMGMCTRDGAGNVKLLGTYGSARPTEVETVNTNLLLGGAGLYGTLKDYLAFLRAVLRCDPRYSSPSKPLLSPESYAQLFKGCVPTAAGRERMTHQMAQAGWIVPPATPETINHSIAMMVTSVDVTDGRKKGSGFWSGAAKTQYWIDPTTGLAVSANHPLLLLIRKGDRRDSAAFARARSMVPGVSGVRGVSLQKPSIVSILSRFGFRRNAVLSPHPIPQHQKCFNASLTISPPNVAPAPKTAACPKREPIDFAH